MFIQVIQGKVADAEGLRAAMDRWGRDLRPGAKGWLGTTGGITDDGTFVATVRFDTEEAARRNSERPEQGAWWAETEKCFDGPVTFFDCPQVDVWMNGGSDDAGFVQVMKVGGVDRAQIERLDETFEQFADQRPDLLGGLRVWTGPDRYVEAAYFTSEAEARAGEQAELPEDVQAMMGEFQEVMANTEYLDLTDPELR